MTALFPDLSGTPPSSETYRYAGVNGLPYAGEPGLLNEREYATRAVMSVRTGFGNFDTANLDEQHCGRTLRDVLTKAPVGEYRVVFKTHQWIRCETKGVRVLYFIEWIEYIERDRQEAYQLTTRQTLKNIPDSR